MVLTLLGLLVVLGFFTFKATHPDHRHIRDDVVLAHDHLAIGPHHHRKDSDPASPSENPSSPEPADDDLYLGPAASPWLNEAIAELLTSYPASTSRRFVTVSAALPSQNQGTSPASPRGPPELRLVLTLS